MLSPLTDKNLKCSLPEPVINILNKVYSRRYDFEKQQKRFAKDRQTYEQNIAKCDSKLNFMQSLNSPGWFDALDQQSKMSMNDKREIVHGKVRAKLEKEVTEQQIAIEDYRLKYEICLHENTVLKQTLDWVQERLEFYQKRWQ